MNKSVQNKLYSFLYLLALYLGIKLLPLNTWISNIYLADSIRIILYIIVIALAIYEIKKMGSLSLVYKEHLSYFLLLPFVLGCISNILYSLFFKVEMTISFVASLFVIDSFETLFCVIIEELLFRMILFLLFNELIKESKYKDLLVILFTSLSFAFMHVINFYGNNPLNVLLQIGYSFVLGLILGFIAFYFETPILCVLGHFLFNYLNTNVYVILYQSEITVSYIIFNALLAFILFIYLFVLYYLTRRKKYASS